MATLASAQAKFEAKMATAGAHWKKGVESGKSAYCTNFGTFLGGQAPSLCAAYNAGVDRISAADFQADVSGKGTVWAAKMRALVGR